MSTNEHPLLEGFLTRVIDRIGKKIAAKDPKLLSLRGDLKKIEDDLTKKISKLYGGYDKIPRDVKKAYGIK